LINTSQEGYKFFLEQVSLRCDARQYRNRYDRGENIDLTKEKRLKVK